MPTAQHEKGRLTGAQSGEGSPSLGGVREAKRPRRTAPFVPQSSKEQLRSNRKKSVCRQTDGGGGGGGSFRGDGGRLDGRDSVTGVRVPKHVQRFSLNTCSLPYVSYNSIVKNRR